jgi:hypothetical protein
MNEEEAIKHLMDIARRLESQDEFDEAVAELCVAFDKANQLLAKDPKHKALCASNQTLIAKIGEMGMERQLTKARAWDQVDPPGNN